jgi:type I restriction enzyme S subunit
MKQSSWIKKPLNEVSINFDYLRKPISSNQREKIKGKYPYYGAANIIGYINKYLLDGNYVLISEDGSVIDEKGYPIVQNVKGKFWVSNHSHILSGNEILTTTFLYYFLKSTKINPYLTGSVQLKLSQKNLNNIIVSFPDVNQQNKISQVFLNIDYKIEINNKINKNLEELAQTLYKRWFVDFEFPNEEGKPYKSSGGEMVESELGVIPRDWEVVKLKDLYNFTGGFAFKGNRIDNNGKFKIITIKNVQNGIMDLTRFDTLEQLPTKVKESQILEIGDIIISLTGNVGRACMVVSENCLLNQRVEKINAINKDYEGFCYFYIRSNETYNKMLALAKGSAQQNLSPVEFSNLKVAFNQKNKSIFKFFNNLRLQLLNHQIQNIKLANIRDLLLPKLMSGEIEVPDME